MINLLRSDFYRLFRSKAFYVCTLIAAFLFAAGAFLTKWLNEMVIKNQNLSTVPELPFQSGMSYGLMSFTDGDVNLFIAIFIAVFVTAEFVHGTMKNAVSKGFSKIEIYLSKVITMTAATYIMILVMILFGLVAGTIVSGNFVETSENFPLKALGMVGMELLLYAALTSLFVMVAMLVRNNGGTIAVNILGIIMFGPLIYQLLDVAIEPKTSFINYSLQSHIKFAYYNIERTGEDVLRGILVGVVFLVVTIVIGMNVFKRSDIK